MSLSAFDRGDRRDHYGTAERMPVRPNVRPLTSASQATSRPGRASKPAGNPDDAV